MASKRYYTCKIVGDGTEKSPYRPKVADYKVSWIGSIPTGEDGKPIHTTCFVLVSTADHTVLRTDQDIEPMPDFALDGKVNGINTAVRGAWMAGLRRHDFTTTGIENTDGYRDALISIARQRDPGFDIDKFDVE